MNGENESRLRLSNVSKTFHLPTEKISVLSAVNMTIHKREKVSIVGPTGCGKTTLLNIIAGFEKPTEGTLTFDGSPIRGPGPERGVIFQQANIFPWLTVWDNVLFAKRFARTSSETFGGKTGQPLESRALELLPALGLAGAERMFPYQISGGMKARTALARMLLLNPPVLLLDEPFAALDAQTRLSIHRLLTRLLAASDDRSMVIITHDVDEAIALADTVYVMSARPGRLLEAISVPYGFPRDLAAMARDGWFIECRARILDALESTVTINQDGQERVQHESTG